VIGDRPLPALRQRNGHDNTSYYVRYRVAERVSMKILIYYATTEGQTRKIAEFVGQQLSGDAVTIVDAVNVPDALDLDQFDAAILAASLHMHRYQAALVEFATDHHSKLNTLPSLFISVSLSAASEDVDDLAGLAACDEKFKAETEWRPRKVLHVAGAFRFTKYDFFKSLVMRRIAKEKKVKVNPHEDLELTGWEALARDIKAFRMEVSR
jgi:menaquinone-dependent protoporphyrinogen oxidase